MFCHLPRINPIKLKEKAWEKKLKFIIFVENYCGNEKLTQIVCFETDLAQKIQDLCVAQCRT